jgi:membrane protease YdiL (CAAX protease family)
VRIGIGMRMGNRESVSYREVKYILYCLAVVLLSCALKNYLFYFLSDTAYCQYLCPSAFGREVFSQPEIINQFYKLQSAVIDSSHALLSFFSVDDNHQLFSGVFAIPLIEEVIYRGPLYLSRKHSSSTIWWLAAILLVVLFTLSHDRSGVALLPVFVLGMSSCWLIMITGKFWPSLSLHFLYNFYFLSITLYQVTLWGD